MALAIGDLVDGKYQIIGLLGSGGMGHVYEGLHRKLHRRVAIKVLKADIADDEMVERFEREAQAAGQIGSHHVAEVYDVGKLASGERFMILEYLEGESLAKRLKRTRTMQAANIFPIAVQILQGLAGAHEAGIVHRDLKPANVYLIDEGSSHDFVKVLDFGVSKFQSARESVTQTGAILGTPQYMAPEQVKGSQFVDARSDLFAVGALIYRALSGSTPYYGDSLHVVLAKLVTEEPMPIQDLLPGLDPGVAAIVNKALRREPLERFQTSDEFIAALTDWLQKQPSPPLPASQRPPRPRPAFASLADSNPSPPDAFAPQAFSAEPATQRLASDSTPSTINTPSPSLLAPRSGGGGSRGRLWLTLGVIAAVAIAIGATALSASDGTPDGDRNAPAVEADDAPAAGPGATTATSSASAAADAAAAAAPSATPSSTVASPPSGAPTPSVRPRPHLNVPPPPPPPAPANSTGRDIVRSL